MIKLGNALHFIGDTFLFLWSSLETIVLLVSVTTIDAITSTTNTLSMITMKIMKVITITNNNTNNNTSNTKVTSNLSLLQSSGIKSGLVLPKKANTITTATTTTTKPKGVVFDKITKKFPKENLLVSSLSSSSLSSNQFKMPVVNNNIRPLLTNLYNNNDDSNDDSNGDSNDDSNNMKINANDDNENSSMIVLLLKTTTDTFKSFYQYWKYDTTTGTTGTTGTTSSNSSNTSTTYTIAPHLLTCLCILSYIVSRKYTNTCIQLTMIVLAVLAVFIYITSLDNLFRKKILTSIGIDAINDFVNKHPQAYSSSTSSSTANNKKGTTSRYPGKSDYEISNWFNIITGAIWNIDGTSSDDIGGYGPYLAKSIEQSLNAELARVPPGIARLQLKNFNLGTKAPIIRAIKVTPYRIPESACTRTKTDMNNKNIGSKMHGELWKWYDMLNKNKGDNDVVIKGCEHLIIEIDVGYVSKEMDIILSLRSNDINSVLPEAFVTVSTLAMAGIITLDSELIPEYPFFGNATFSFKELPNLEMTLSSFGGVDLSAIPGVRNFIDISIKWLMSQYTNPNVGTINMISYLCPSCLDIEPKLNYIEKIIKMTKNLYGYLKNARSTKNTK